MDPETPPEPVQPDAEQPLFQAEITVSDKLSPQYSLALYPDLLVLQPVAGPPAMAPPPMYPAPPPGHPAVAPPAPPAFVFQRQDVGSKLVLSQGLFLNNVLMFETPHGRKGSNLPPEVAEQIRDWMGPLTQANLAGELKSRVAWLLPVAGFFLLLSLMAPGPRAVRFGGLAVDPVTVGLALGLGLIYLLGRYRPRPPVFLLDAAWWIALGTDNFLHPGEGVSGTIGYVFGVLCLWFAVGAVRSYLRYRTVRPDQKNL